MIGRRSFLRASLGRIAAGAWVADGAAAALAAPDPPRSRAYVDGLASLDIEYSKSLFGEMADGGVRVCVASLGTPRLASEAAFGRAVKDVGAFAQFAGRWGDRLTVVKGASDLERAQQAGKLALVYAFENAGVLGDEIERLDVLFKTGVRVLQLTYNVRNDVGDGYLEPTNGGLSRFGLDVIGRMNELGMLVDVSHCADATSDGAILFSSAPCAITHAGCRAVFEHPRNKPDETLKNLARKGGVVGIYQTLPFLGPPSTATAPGAGLELYLSHVDHAIDVAGIDHVGVASDRDYRRASTSEARRRQAEDLARDEAVEIVGATNAVYVEELASAKRMDVLADALQKRGRSAADVDKILGGNFRRLLQETLKRNGE
ncbi:MAG: membrane dipeptidase [Vicinamibacterales bacterium]